MNGHSMMIPIVLKRKQLWTFSMTYKLPNVC
jgi:hypothetical protein